MTHSTLTISSTLDRFLTREREADGKKPGLHFVPADIFDALQGARVGAI